jgi:N-acetylglucosamine kinase-like BadF-type ATPase
MQAVLAVDGGNTKTIALVAALDGRALGAARGGVGDIYNAEPEDGADGSAGAALVNVERTVKAALDAAHVARADLAVSVFNMAGADWPEDIAFWRDKMSERGYGQRVIAQNDALGVLYAASPDATGVAIVCGTGVATGARSADGRVWHSSFWQDEAQGAGHMGHKTLFAVYRAALGIEQPTSLTERVVEHFGAESVEAVLHLFHDRAHPAPERVDLLTPILLDEADAGDAVALAVVGEHGASLGNIAIAAARQVGLEGSTEFPLVLAGGVFRHPTHVLEAAIVARVQGALPRAVPVRNPAEPIVGVLLEALAAAGVETEGALRERVLRTWREASDSVTGVPI